MRILGLDPGKTTGYALIEITDRKIRPKEIGETTDKKLISIRELFEMADVIVVENFLNRPSETRRGAFDWKSNEASQVIGSAETLAALHGKKLVRQEPSSKPVGYGLAGLNYKKGVSGRGVHQQDAIAHAVFYAVKAKLADPVVRGK